MKGSIFDEKQEKLADIESIISNSVEFKDVKHNVIDKVKSDFQIATDYVEENYKKAKEISAFLLVFKMPDWEKDEVSFDEIRQKINMFIDWNT